MRPRDEPLPGAATNAMPSSAIDPSAIAARAAGIYERAAGLTPRDLEAVAIDPEPAAAAAIHAWNRAFSPGDPAAFLHRLAWDDLDLETVLAAAADSARPACGHGWTTWLERVADAARDVSAQVAAGRFAVDPELDVPFEEIWTAFRRAAAAGITLPSEWEDCITPEALAALERQLCVELSRQGELALLEYYRTSGVTPEVDLGCDTRGHLHLATFVSRLLADGLVPLFAEYPALARALVSVTSDWVDATTEFLVRLREDAPEIASAFDGDPGAAIAIETGLSDPHHGRRRVAAVQFRSGLRLVYKPRDLRLERAFNAFLHWINPRLEVPVRTLRVLDRGTYGWVEFAAHAAVADAGEAARSYQRSGSLMCVAYLLGAQDLHMENLVVTADGPALVDTEMLLQPLERHGIADAGGPRTGAAPAGSALDTGMLSLITVTDDGTVYDSGGLRGQVTGPLPFPHRVWRNLRCDAIHFEEEPSYRSAGRHRTRVGDAVQDPRDYAPAFLEGFADAYRCLLERRDELLRPSGPLYACAGASARVTLRPTNQYAMLSFVLAGPKYQRGGVARSTAVDVLHRSFAGADARPALWAAAVEERRAIARLDVPYFSVRCDGTDLLCDGRVVVANHFACSGLDAALARVRHLSDRHLDAQLGLLRRALSESSTSRYGAPPPSAESDDERAVEFGLWIANELLSRADRRRDALVWRDRTSTQAGLEAHDLYQGSLGPVLLLAALAATTGDRRWRDHALGALLPLRRAIDSGALAAAGPDPNIGGAAGLGSIVYGLSVAGSLLDDASVLDLASTVAAALAPRIDADDNLDVIDGAAGAALALLALAEATGRPDMLPHAIACGDHLIGRSVVVGDGAAWPSRDGSRLVGFAHGTAGIAAALARLFRATREPRFLEAAILGVRFVEHQFAARSGGYPIAASNGAETHRGTMLAWCHGAPGIVLGLCRELDILPKTAILSQFDTALRAVARDEPAQVDHVCCGAFGRVDAVLSAARAWGRADLEREAWQLAADVARRAVVRGHFRLSGSGVDYRVFDPGFFRGLSGIGYQWLRLANPALPSVAGFEPGRRP